MAEFPLPVPQIGRSPEWVTIQIQLMNIHVSECKYHCIHLVLKFGDVHDRQNWQLHPTAYGVVHACAVKGSGTHLLAALCDFARRCKSTCWLPFNPINCIWHLTPPRFIGTSSDKILNQPSRMQVATFICTLIMLIWQIRTFEGVIHPYRHAYLFIYVSINQLCVMQDGLMRHVI